MDLIEIWRKYRELIEFVGLVIVWPALAYWLIYGVDEYNERGARPGAAILAITGMVAWVAIKVRRGG